MTALSTGVDAPPSPADNDALFDRLRALDRECGGPDGNKHDRAIVLIHACIDRGINTKSQIIGVLRQIDFNPRHVGKVLIDHLGSDPVRHYWRADDEGLLHTLN